LTSCLTSLEMCVCAVQNSVHQAHTYPLSVPCSSALLSLDKWYK